VSTRPRQKETSPRNEQLIDPPEFLATEGENEDQASKYNNHFYENQLFQSELLLLKSDKLILD
jgi:hypothetical protein